MLVGINPSPFVTGRRSGPNESVVLYNAACTYCALRRKPEALEALIKAWTDGFRDDDWVPSDPDLALNHGEPGYTMLGRLFAYGYIRALLQMT